MAEHSWGHVDRRQGRRHAAAAIGEGAFFLPVWSSYFFNIGKGQHKSATHNIVTPLSASLLLSLSPHSCPLCLNFSTV